MALEPSWTSGSAGRPWSATAMTSSSWRKPSKKLHQTTDRPTVIIAHTVKGKGIDYMEDQPGWHYGGIDSGKEKLALESIDRMYGITQA